MECHSCAISRNFFREIAFFFCKNFGILFDQTLENDDVLILVPSGKVISNGESPITEVKQLRATSVLGWVTARGEAVQLRDWANFFFFTMMRS